MFRFTLKMDSSQLSTWSVRTSGRRQEFLPTSKQLLRSYVDSCSIFWVGSAWPSPNKLICLFTVFIIRCEVETKLYIPFTTTSELRGSFNRNRRKLFTLTICFDHAISQILEEFELETSAQTSSVVQRA